MRFWDSSALVPLVIEEATSPRCRQLLRTDSRQIVWTLSRVEIVSALCRHRRSGALDAVAMPRAEARVARLAARWSEVDLTAEVRDLGERILHTHSLRAADAMQLAAAIATFDGRPRGRPFVTLDDALAEAAMDEGFLVLVPREA